LDTLLDFCSDYGIEFSFDIVGHLFHKECDGEHECTYTEELLGNDPATDLNTDPLYYAPDLIESIRDSEPCHDLISHTYTHPRLDQISKEAIRWEFNQLDTVFEEAGLSAPTALVPPKHFVPPDQILKELDIETIRMPDPDYSRPDDPGKLHLLYWYLFRRHPIGDPVNDGGIIKTHSTSHSSLTTPLLGKGQHRLSNPYFTTLIPKRFRQRDLYYYLKEGLDRAIENDTHIHFWTHLWNLNEDQLPPIKNFMRYLSQMESEGKVSITPMSKL
jgi:hypothetical protein